MKAYEYILAKQIAWAQNNNINLVGSKTGRGRLAYAKFLKDNLFEDLLPQTMKELQEGDGCELKGDPPKIAAVHSSSALAVNMFQYWQRVGAVPTIAAACGLCTNSTPCRIRFEQKFQICPEFRYAPNIDVVIETNGKTRFKVYGVECKFSEAYRGHSGLDPKYLNLMEIWDDIPAIRTLAETISPNDARFKYLHAAQLIKHVLGLKQKYRLQEFRLLYLWYDAIGDEGAVHSKEIREFSDIVKKDPVQFHSFSYQELIAKLSKDARKDHGRFVEYISARYL
jgi:hypothetical protein